MNILTDCDGDVSFRFLVFFLKFNGIRTVANGTSLVARIFPARSVAQATFRFVNYCIGAPMKRLIIEASIVATILTTFGFAATMATAQMGLRENDLFASQAFMPIR